MDTLYTQYLDRCYADVNCAQAQTDMAEGIVEAVGNVFEAIGKWFGEVEYRDKYEPTYRVPTFWGKF